MKITEELRKCADERPLDVEIEVKAGWNGGYVDTIETNGSFFCANYKAL